MRTIRGRLAAWYAVALAATMFVFAAIIYLVQLREDFDELDARLELESNLIAAILTEGYRARGALVVADAAGGPDALHPDVLLLLEGVTGYVVVAGRDGDVLHLSADARALPYGSLVQLLAPVLEIDSGAARGAVDLGSPVGEILYHTRALSTAGPRVGGVLLGSPVSSVVLGPRRLLSTMLLVAPLILLSSLFVGYTLVGRTLAPVNQVVDEVEAISDGRSLHKRLAPLQTGDELARLTSTLNAMFARLERSFATLRRFTADASHELKTPLTVLRAGIERSITHPQTPPEVMQELDETLREAYRMTEIIDSLLTLARADEGRVSLHLETVDLRELFAEVAETASLLGEDASVGVTVAPPPEHVPLAVDRARIRQLLMNLLTNAIKYTAPGGAVAIKSTIGNGSVAISVRDTGVGIAPGDLPHIFDRFWRADLARSRTGARPGVGLGLAISKWIAEAHGGTITATSRPGKGTTFVVTLPVAKSGDATGGAP